MLDEKRKFSRYDVPLIMEFKPAKETANYSWGLTKDFSYDGFSFESNAMDFELRDQLEFRLKFPQKGAFISVTGAVVWKKPLEHKCLAGIMFRAADEKIKKDIFEKIRDYNNTSSDRILQALKPVDTLKEKIMENPMKKVSSKVKKVKPFVEDILTEPQNAGISKQYLKTRPVCKVTFRLPKEAAAEAKFVALVGEFNNWDQIGIPMKRSKNGDFTVTLDLAAGREYRFKYLIDGTRWENDWKADKYIPNEFGIDDSVVVV
ncbi:MAG: PilZ domain-containing protein [Nitrospirae bacterium]|nr:PilZ domain-containing protein [Nitrospirota bacterium]